LNGQTILHMFRRYDSRASRLSWQILSRPSTPIHGDQMPGLCTLLGTSYWETFIHVLFWTELASCVHSTSGVDSLVDVFQMSGRALKLCTSQRLSLTPQTRLSCLTYINLPVRLVINFYIIM
jgi:hypothetical protein